MTHILIIDDEPMYHKMIAHLFSSSGFEIAYAEDGERGIQAAKAQPPDLIICDVLMPLIDGYEVTRRLRRIPAFAYTPILILTSQLELEDKLQAFEAGADDHMTKPFVPAELLAHITALLRRSRATKPLELNASSSGHLIAYHSLRGGVGCTSLAVNTAVALKRIWQKEILLMDLVLTTGQDALMLNEPLKHTWANITNIPPEELDYDVLDRIIIQHKSGLRLIAAPTLPEDGELFTPELYLAALNMLRSRFDYIVADLAHDFAPIALHTLDAADLIVLVMAPEMASIRAASAALDTYKKLGYPSDRIRIVLNWTFERRGIARKSIENAFHRPVNLVLPYLSEIFVEAINYGQPIVLNDVNQNVIDILETFAYQLSKAEDQKKPSPNPSPSLKSILQRLKSK
jgi:pilus assembly protein CpaE